MWHLNIPIFRRLDQVAEHERGAVLALARTWWGFGERLPMVMRSARLNGLTMPRPPSSTMPRPAAKVSEAELNKTEEVRPRRMESVDVGFEVMCAASRGQGHWDLGRGHTASVNVEDGFVRATKPLATGAGGIFKVVSRNWQPGPTAPRPVKHSGLLWR